VRGRVLVLRLHGGGKGGHGLEVHAVQLFVGLGVLQGDGDLPADRGEERDLLRPELVLVAEADHQRPDDALLAREGHHQVAAQLVRGARERAETFVGLGVGDLETLAMLHGPRGELGGRLRGHRAVVTAAERRPRRVPLVHEKDAHHVRVQHGADHVGETPERQGRAEGAEVADLEGERLGLLGEPVDARRDPLGHGVERPCEAADLVAALGGQLLVAISV
jgi:hypothetical protein